MRLPSREDAEAYGWIAMISVGAFLFMALVALWRSLPVIVGVCLFLWLTACSAPQTRENCDVLVYAHPSKPSPAGRIVVRCDGREQAVIDADKVNAP